MKDEEVREFLMRWLMEFGTEPVPWSRRSRCEWYTSGLRSVPSEAFNTYFDYSSAAHDAFTLNQAGLNFIKEK